MERSFGAARRGARGVRIRGVEIERFGSGTAWEPVVGYSRVVRAGPLVVVSGCTSTGPDGEFVDGDAAAQARRAIANVVAALERAGARVEDVVQTRIYVTDIGEWEAVGRAHGEVFGDIRPATAMVQVSALIDPRMRVEIEAMVYSPRLE
jgi:enamine deaminase RidA (YjgF/YER057c/UK114 family)